MCVLWEASLSGIVPVCRRDRGGSRANRVYATTHIPYSGAPFVKIWVGFII